MTTKLKPKIPISVILGAIISLTILETIALLKGIDGTIFTIVMVIIAGLGGTVIPLEKFIKLK